MEHTVKEEHKKQTTGTKNSNQNRKKSAILSLLSDRLLIVTHT